jgi:UDP-N-acetylmuramate dehydrogenase
VEKLKTIDIQDVELKLDIDLEKYTTIKLAEQGSIAIVKTIDGLKNLLDKLSELEFSYHLVGWGANQVLLNTKDTLFIKLDFSFDRKLITPDKNEFELPASTPLNQLTSLAVKHGFKGWEVFTGVPASLGGAICMNAGTSLGEIGDLIKSVKIMCSKGEVRDYIPTENSFVYRNNNFLNDGDIIVSAVIIHHGIDSELGTKINQYLDYRKSTQPLTTKNCGSVFKNLENFRAGKTIDQLGLKGFGFDHLAVSLMHGNFIENLGNAKAEEFEQLIQLLKDEIERHSGLKFELEVKLY